MTPDLTPRQVADLLRSEHPPLIVDVREPAEVAVAAIEGSVSIPMREIPSRLDEIPTDTPLVFVCHHGARSRQVAVWLSRQGYTDLGNLAGGIDAWSRDVDPTIPRY